MGQDLPEHVQKNRMAWDSWAAEFTEWAWKWPCEEIWKARKH